MSYLKCYERIFDMKVIFTINERAVYKIVYSMFIFWENLYILKPGIIYTQGVMLSIG